ncbi:MAG: bifunctional precorrin-2 dehydrogenase/sirohydrochlorin ferrochelatase [bacterium]|nr:bifunctional precorrin-2 dehydrogenase/sirohydrochlorin ferrochelatase [bacterium]
MRTHPVFLRLEGRACVVVGGDEAALAKALACREAGAAVTIIAPELPPGAEAGMRWLRRGYEAGDLRGAALCYAVTADAALIARLEDEARRERVLLNVLDVPAACDFFAAAVVTRGDLQIAVGTGGESPALAARLRRRLADLVGPEYDTYLTILGAVRRRLDAGPGRGAVLAALLDSDLLELVRRDDRPGIDRLLAEVAGRACTLGALGLEAPSR